MAHCGGRMSYCGVILQLQSITDTVCSKEVLFVKLKELALHVLAEW